LPWKGLREEHSLTGLPKVLWVVSLAEGTHFVLVHNRAILTAILDSKLPLVAIGVKEFTSVGMLELDRLATEPISETIFTNNFPIIS
jgi:hypothetical protein